MSWFNNLKTGSKLILIYVVAFFLFIALNIFTIFNIISMGEIQDLGATRAEDAITLGTVTTNFKSVYENVADVIINKNYDEFRRNSILTKEQNKKDIVIIKEIADTKEEKEFCKEYEIQCNKFFDLIENGLIPIMTTNNTIEIQRIDEQFDNIRRAAEKQLTLFSNSIKEEAKLGDQEFDKTKINSIRTIIISLIIIIIISFVYLLMVIKRYINNPISKLLNRFNQIFTLKSSAGSSQTKDEIEILSNMILSVADDQQNLAKDLSAQSKLILHSSEGLLEISNQTASSSEELLVQTTTAAASSEQISANVSTVTSAIEEMTASIREISKNTTHSTKIIDEATKKTEEAGRVMDRLGVSSAEIGHIVKSITSIAEQTNLLALNATIEAARAGESGKGFAVVANEVKELAKEAAKATEDITNKIKAINEDSGNAIKVIKEINEITEQVNDITRTIASAVEEQSATANEINRSVSEASNGSNSLSEINVGISGAAKDSARMSLQIKESAEQLEKFAKALENKLKSNFKL